MAASPRTTPSTPAPGLANQHAAVFRDHDAIRAHAGSRVELAEEYAVAERLGLHQAARLLAVRLAPRDEALTAVCADPQAGDDDVRRALLAALRAPAEVG